MKKTFFLLMCCLYCTSPVLAQELVTNFENDSTQSPNNLSYLGTVNNIALFTAFTPETGNEIWVSDGTVSGTKILKDIKEGELGIYPSSFVVFNSWAYFIVDGNIWKTDGTPEKTFEVATVNKANSEYFLNLKVINNKLLAVFNNYKASQSFDFYWLTATDKLVKWEQGVISYNIKENSLFYTKNTGNEANPVYTLYHYLKDSKEIYSTKTFISGLTQFKNKSDIYCSITIDNTTALVRTLIKIDEKGARKNQQFDWGNHQDTVPLYYKNDEEDFYLLKASSFKNGIDSLFLYKIEADRLIVNKKIGGKGINPSFSYTGGTHFFSNPIYKNNTLFYANGHTIEGGSIYYFNFLDFTNNTFSQTKASGSFLYRQIEANSISDSLYEVKNYYDLFHYQSFIYSLNSKTVIKNTRNILDNSILTFQIKNQNFEISDNVYKVNESNKEPLITTRKIYINNSSSQIINRSHNGKHYFSFNGYNQKTSEIWAIDSLNSKKLKTINGYSGSFFEAKNINNKLLFPVWDRENLKFSIYETDGTKSGTTLAYTFDNSPTSPLNILSSNDSFITLYTNEKYIVISKNRTYEIPMTEGAPVYLDNNIYFIKDYKTLSKLENGKLKTILKFNGLGNHFVFNQRFYFQNGKELSYLDENEEVKTIVTNLDFFYVSNYYLVYNKYTLDNNYLNTIIDLRTNKVVAKILGSSFNYTFQNGIGVYSTYDSNGSLARVGIYDEKAFFEISSANERMYPTIYKEGVLIKYESVSNGKQTKLVYYDSNTKQFTTILSGTLSFSFKANEKADFILIQLIENNEVIYKTWSYKTKKLKSVSTEKGEYFFLDRFPAENYAISYNSNNYEAGRPIWSFQNDSLVRQEPPAKNIRDIRLEDIVLFQTKFKTDTGNELFAIGDGFSINFPEIVKGREGIQLGNTFVFNNQLYVYCYTYSYGWQVWKINEKSEVLPLANEEETSDELISFFPNPVENTLNVKAIRPFNYRIVNVMGQEMMQGKLADNQPINLENLIQGLYIIQFYDKETTVSKKLVKH